MGFGKLIFSLTNSEVSTKDPTNPKLRRAWVNQRNQALGACLSP
jgi:hypothetical protein